MMRGRSTGKPTAERVLGLLSFDAETGEFYWKKKMGPATEAGALAGHIEVWGYRIICIDGRKQRAHQLVWLCVHGEWPPKQIDHINRIRHDNRPENLRLATDAENRQNMSRPAHNKSGFIGVCWDASRQKWMASIKVNRRQKYLGRFTNICDAVAAYRGAKRELHRFHGGAIE